MEWEYRQDLKLQYPYWIGLDIVRLEDSNIFEVSVWFFSLDKTKESGV